jgi:hypothetical protein
VFRRSADIIVIVAIAALTFGLNLAIAPTSIVRQVLGLLFMLVLPGYAATAAIFDRRKLGIPERLLFTLGLSIAIAVAGSLALNATPWGLQQASWSILLAAFTLVTGLIALWRDRRVGSGGAAAPAFALPLSLHQALLFGLATLIVAGAMLLASQPTPPQPDQGYTILSILPSTNASPNALRLSIKSLELTPLAYQLQIQVDGRAIQKIPIAPLPPGEQWEQVVELPAIGTARKEVRAVLYRGDKPDLAYRYVILRPNQ